MARRVTRVTMEETAIMMEESEEMIEMDTHNITSGEQHFVKSSISTNSTPVIPDLLNELLPAETEGITKEQDEEIMKAKQRQVRDYAIIHNLCVKKQEVISQS